MGRRIFGSSRAKRASFSASAWSLLRSLEGPEFFRIADQPSRILDRSEEWIANS
jgi:hypothetical protein